LEKPRSLWIRQPPSRVLRLQPSHRRMILAHRGNTEGPRPATENRAAAVRAALASGWGVETDIRRAADGRFYISHDARLDTEIDDLVADEFCALFRAYPRATIALNIKELGDEAALIAYLDAQNVLAQTLLFDMELLEARAGDTAARFRDLHPTVRLAARVSDRGESLDRALGIASASVIWLDEFERRWCTEADIRRLKDASRTVYAVSPELHGFPLAAARSRWIDLVGWGADGICTDFPAELERVLRTAVEATAS
jgi:glycerophosphoryl diester phosphodiesterase